MKVPLFFKKLKKEYRFPLLSAIPIIGIICFVLLFLYASTRYPGGSQADLNSEGFDWMHNYWCNLLNEQGMNNSPNPARPYSIGAMVILCSSLMVFFFQFGRKYERHVGWRKIIQFGGIGAMGFASLIFTKYHDLMTSISSIFGLLVVVGMIRVITQSNWTAYKLTAIGCLMLLALNNIIYYTEIGIEFLPLIQKISFVAVLCWIAGLSSKMMKD